MPNPQSTNPTGSTVQANLSGWPGADELPLPAAGEPSADASARPAPATTVLRRTGAGSSDAAAEPGAEQYPPLYLVDVDPWTGLPNAQMLPMPTQLLAAAPAAVETASADAIAPSVASDDQDGGAAPVEDLFAALLSLLVAALAMARRLRWPVLLAGLQVARVKLVAAPLNLVRFMLLLMRLW